MKPFKYPIIPFTIFIAAGIFAGFYMLCPLWLIVLLLSISTILAILSHASANKQLIQKPYFAATVVCFAFSAGLLAQYISYAPNNPQHYSHKLPENSTPVIKGVITERLKPNDFNERYLLNITAIDSKPAEGKILVTVPKPDSKKMLHTGDVLYINGGLTSINKALNPYQFDYAAYMAKQNVFHSARLKENYIQAGQTESPDYLIQHLRDILINSFSIHRYKPEIQNLINALLFGQRQDMDKETTADYTNAGVVHILAISGLHFTLLFAMLNWLLAPLKRWKRFGTAGHFIAILSLMWLFAFLTGLSASVVRSVVMFSFLMIGESLNRRVSIYNSLAVSALVLLIAKPGFLFDAGFQLSYLAVLGIVWLQPIYKKWGKSRYAIVNMGYDLAAVSLAAQIAVLPLSLYYFNQFPLLFLVGNIVVIPLSNAVLILGIITLLLNFAFPPLALWAGKLLEICITFMNGFIKWIASFENLVLRNIPFTQMLAVSLYILIILAALYLLKPSYNKAMAALASVLLFQAAYMITVYTAEHKSELAILHNYHHTIILNKWGKQLHVISRDKKALENRNVQAYTMGNFNPEVQVQQLSNYLFFNNQKIFVLDSTGIYNPEIKLELLLVTNSPKVNFDRLLLQLKPKQVVADATNYRTYINRWAQSCRKQKIPFHATAEKGSYIVK